jgi:hypothetical protein
MTPENRWRRWLRPELVLVFFVLTRLPVLGAPVGGQHHMWRQADTAAVARNLAFESPDIFHPRMDMREDKTGITGMEFPVYQAVVAVFMAVTRSDADFFGKLVALLSTVGCWLLLARLLTRRLGLSPWAVHVACASVPILLGYADKFMPESTALLLALITAERVESWWHSGQRRELVQGTVAMALACLARPYMVFFGLFILVGAVMALRRREKLLPLLVSGVVALVPFGLWYGLWCPHLVRAYGTDYFFTGSPVGENLAQLATRGFYKELGEVLTWFYVKKPLVLLAIIGLGAAPALVRASRSPWWTVVLLVGLPVVTLPLLLLVIGDHFQPHIYYFFGLVPSVVLWLALGLDVVLRHATPAFPVAAVFAVANALGTFPAHFSVHDVEWVRYRDVVAQVEKDVPPTDLVVVENLGHFPWHLHPIRRRGWVVDRVKMDDATFMRDVANRGGRWVLWLDKDANLYRLSSMEAWLQRPAP